MTKRTKKKRLINDWLHGGREGWRSFLTLPLKVFLDALQADCVVWVNTTLDLKEDRQEMLQKSFIVPLTSTAAMMRSWGSVIALWKRRKSKHPHLECLFLRSWLAVTWRGGGVKTRGSSDDRLTVGSGDRSWWSSCCWETCGRGRFWSRRHRQFPFSGRLPGRSSWSSCRRSRRPAPPELQEVFPLLCCRAWEPSGLEAACCCRRRHTEADCWPVNWRGCKPAEAPTWTLEWRNWPKTSKRISFGRK